MNRKTHISATLACILASAILASVARAQSITLDRTQYFQQTAFGALSAAEVPFSFGFNIRGDSDFSMQAWRPRFFVPGGSTPTGSSSATNTGTLNFSEIPNDGIDFSFVHLFSSNNSMISSYPVMAGADRQYGVQFTGTRAPTPSTFTTGLKFEGGNYAVATPQLTAADNGAAWSSGILQLSPTGVTKLTFNTFTEYGAGDNPRGASLTLDVHSGNQPVPNAALELYDFPTFNYHDALTNQISIDSSWLQPGVTYTLELEFGVFASAPTESSIQAVGLSDEVYTVYVQGFASYYKNTRLNLRIGSVTPAYLHPVDFNRDSRTDLLWRNLSTGELYLWFMNGPTLTGFTSLGAVSLDWETAGTGDFNNDGKTDILWRNKTTGQLNIWFMDGTTFIGAVFVGAASLDWSVATTGDLNNDGKTDIIWQNTNTGERYVWFMDGATPIAYSSLGSAAVGWLIVGTGDFNGDGKMDIIWQHTGTGQRHLWFMNGAVYLSGASLAVVDPQWSIAATSDLNNDGKADIIWENGVTGERHVWLMDGAVPIGYHSLGYAAAQWSIVN